MIFNILYNMIYKSAISNLNKYIYIACILFLLILTIPALYDETYTALIIISSINFSMFLFLFWIYKSTYYTVKNDFLLWKSGPFYGEIDIKSITKIEFHKGIIVPTIWKPALSHEGLIITYNKYDDIYFSPEKQIDFISTLQRINPNITIKNKPYVD